MPDRLKVKFLVVIWGARYIEEFARISLPSYLAEGNLPYVAAETDLEILIMTTRESRATIEEQPAFAKLKLLCSVRYIFIDDLISTGVYGVTLTLAFARGIKDSGSEQVNTNFIFMNSDFVLSNGSLHTLMHRLCGGDRCVMAPSLRARAESVVPELAEAAENGGGVISLSSRQMVRLAFENLHPTVIGKTVTQELTTCGTHNQIYWQVDKTALLARYHLIFMLAIKPEVPLGLVNSYCDYGFVPELVPSGEFSILDDSDDFFMLELQPAAQEKNLLRIGTSSLAEIADEISFWSTREHRRFANVDVLFRTGDHPAQLANARSKFARYFDSLKSRMSTATADHAYHYYWVMGVRAWASLKNGSQASEALLLAELEDTTASFQQTNSSMKEGARAGISGWYLSMQKSVRAGISGWYLSMLARAVATRWPETPLWHYLWLDGRLVLNWLKAVGRQGERNLLICRDTSPLAVYFEQLSNFDVDRNFSGLAGVDASPSTSRASDDRRYDNILLHVCRADIGKTRLVADVATRRLTEDGTLGIFVEHVYGESDLSNLSSEMAQHIDDILPSDWIGYRLSARFAGGKLKRRLRLGERRLRWYLWPSSIWKLPHLAVAATARLMIAAITATNNVWHRKSSDKCPTYCSSFLLSLSCAEEVGAPNIRETSASVPVRASAEQGVAHA